MQTSASSRPNRTGRLDPYAKPPQAVEAALRERGIGWTNGNNGGTFTAEECPVGCGQSVGMQWLGDRFVFNCRGGDPHDVVRAALGISADADDGRYLPPEPPENAAVRLLLVDMAKAIAAADDPIPCVIEPLAARGFLTVLAGRHSSGKSWLAILLGAAAHGGRTDLAGFKLDPCPVLYVDAENGARLMGRRFRDAGIPAEGLLVADGTELHLPNDLARLAELVVSTGAGLVVLDSLRRLASSARENESDSMAVVIAGLAKLARDCDVAVLLIHHRSVKAGAAATRGSSSIEDQADCVFLLDRHRGDGGRRKLSVEKFRLDAEPPTRWLSLGLDFTTGTVTLGETDAREEDPEEAPSAEDALTRRIRDLAEQARADGGWEPRRLAMAAGTHRRNGTFQRAIAALLLSGEWVAEGSTKARKLRPRGANEIEPDSASGAGSGDPGTIRTNRINALEDGADGANEEAPEWADRLAEKYAPEEPES